VRHLTLRYISNLSVPRSIPPVAILTRPSKCYEARRVPVFDLTYSLSCTVAHGDSWWQLLTDIDGSNNLFSDTSEIFFITEWHRYKKKGARTAQNTSTSCIRPVCPGFKTTGLGISWYSWTGFRAPVRLHTQHSTAWWTQKSTAYNEARTDDPSFRAVRSHDAWDVWGGLLNCAVLCR
jgi:hypothetical protein